MNLKSKDTRINVCAHCNIYIKSLYKTLRVQRVTTSTLRFNHYRIIKYCYDINDYTITELC